MINLSNPPAPLAKIDWYSFTLPVAGPPSGAGPDTLEMINHVLRTALPPVIDPIDNDGTWRVEPAKGFYSFRATHVQSKVAVSWGVVNAHVFVELAGQSCDYLRAAGAFSAVVTATAERVSRLDCAIDIRTATTPEVFVSAGHAIRFADSTGNIKSKTGDTYYVGSRKSDRCARVYRYAKPHPRSGLLRVETEYKGKAARALALLLDRDGELEAIRAAHAVFEWKSEEMTLDFLQHRNYARDPAINPVTGSTVGLWTPFFPLSFGINPRDLWTLGSGWKRWYNRRWKRRMH